MKAVIIIFSIIFALIFGYLVGSFIAADFNIKNWDGMGRFLIATLSIMFAAGAAAGVEELTK